MSKTLGMALRQIRKTKKLTLRDVESKTEISNSYLNQLENDKIKKPTPHTLHTLAQFYQVPYYELMELAGYLLPNELAGYKKVYKSIATSLREELTPEEEEKVAEFIEFLRSKKRK